MRKDSPSKTPETMGATILSAALGRAMVEEERVRFRLPTGLSSKRPYGRSHYTSVT
jgi:hypothetical protein